MTLWPPRVVQKSDILITASHVLYAQYSCKLKHKLADCFFVRKTGDTKVGPHIKIQELMGAGYQDRCLCGDKIVNKDDWAVMTLVAPADVVPYKVPDDPASEVVKNKGVVLVASLSVNFERPTGNDNVTFPKYYEDW